MGYFSQTFPVTLFYSVVIWGGKYHPARFISSKITIISIGQEKGVMSGLGDSVRALQVFNKANFNSTSQNICKLEAKPDKAYAFAGKDGKLLAPFAFSVLMISICGYRAVFVGQKRRI